jgi:hypothetical protein
VGLAWRRDRLGFSGWYATDVFTQIEMPMVFHGSPFSSQGHWHWAELVFAVTPSYTWSMNTTDGPGPDIQGTESLRTRVNLEYGWGFQAKLFWGMAMRAYWANRILPPYSGTSTGWNAWRSELTLPLLWKTQRPARGMR